MFKKGHWLYSVFKYKCPRCHEGDYFPVNNPYNLKRLTETYENCPNCGLNYEVEPGFYFGAMYISYALGGGSSILIYWILSAFTEIAIFNQLFIILGYLIVVSPILFKLSRIAWINIFIHYDRTGNFENDGENPLE